PPTPATDPPRRISRAAFLVLYMSRPLGSAHEPCIPAGPIGRSGPSTLRCGGAPGDRTMPQYRVTGDPQTPTATLLHAWLDPRPMPAGRPNRVPTASPQVVLVRDSACRTWLSASAPVERRMRASPAGLRLLRPWEAPASRFEDHHVELAWHLPDHTHPRGIQIDPLT